MRIGLAALVVIGALAASACGSTTKSTAKSGITLPSLAARTTTTTKATHSTTVAGSKVEVKTTSRAGVTTSTLPPTTTTTAAPDRLPDVPVNCFQVNGIWTSVSSSSAGGKVGAVAAAACSQIGDTSNQSFVPNLYAQVGAPLPTFAGAICGGGTPVQLHEVKIGDVVCMGPGGSSAVAIYEGGGRMVQAFGIGPPIRLVPVDLTSSFFVIPYGAN